jgi:hypothetical protein
VSPVTQETQVEQLVAAFDAAAALIANG